LAEPALFRSPLRLFGPCDDLALDHLLSHMARPPRARGATERVEDAMREIGTLLIAFAPLDAALSPGPMPTAAFLLLFLGLGLTLFVGALLIEKGRTRDH